MKEVVEERIELEFLCFKVRMICVACKPNDGYIYRFWEPIVWWMSYSMGFSEGQGSLIITWHCLGSFH